jgi:Type II secretion system (T2SS), protein E, N-terminal domain
VQIGELLIEQGHLTREGLEEALDWQVLYGGRLGTNLLELQLCEEEHLARALGKQLGCEVAWGNLEIDPTLVEIIPPHIAQRDEMVPWKIERRRLKVLVTRIHLGNLDELAYRIGKPCAAVVAPEFRVINLLRAHYGAMRQMRALDFGVVPEEGRLSRRKKKAQERSDALQGVPELIDEKAFHEIYNQVLAGRTAAPAQPAASAAPPPAASPPAPQASGAAAEPAAQVPAPAIAQAPPAPAASAVPAPQAQPAAPAPPPQAAPPAVVPEAQAPAAVAPPPQAPPPAVAPAAQPPPPQRATVAGSSGDAAAAQDEEAPTDKVALEPIEALPEEAILGEAIPEVAAPGWEAPAPAERRVDDSPLPFQKALELLRSVQDRDSIARIVLRASRSKAERALLLLVQGGVVIGWDGLGEGLESGAAGRVAVPLGAPSAFDLVVKTRSHFLGPLQKTPLNIRFLAQTGKKVPLSSLVVPILHRERVSHILYLDNGHKKQAPTDVGEMLILSQRIAQSVDALVDKRKAART